MKTLEYQISIVIKKPRQLVCESYVDYEQLKNHQQPNLESYRLLEGRLYEPGSVVELVYNHNGQMFVMHEKLLACDLPDSITQMFVMGGIKNKCVSNFTELTHGTLWHMDVVFQFETDQNQDRQAFMSKTKEDMLAFKAYVETL